MKIEVIASLSHIPGTTSWDDILVYAKDAIVKESIATKRSEATKTTA